MENPVNVPGEYNPVKDIMGLRLITLLSRGV